MTRVIDRLIDCERPYGEPEYSQLAEKASRIQKELTAALEPQENILLQQLIDVYTAQYMPIVRDAFRDGFCTAVALFNEVQYHKLKEESSHIHM